MNKPRALQWQHSQAYVIWPDGPPFKGTVRPDWICMRVVPLESPLKGHQTLCVFVFLISVLSSLLISSYFLGKTFFFAKFYFVHPYIFSGIEVCTECGQLFFKSICLLPMPQPQDLVFSEGDEIRSPALNFVTLTNQACTMRTLKTGAVNIVSFW